MMNNIPDTPPIPNSYQVDLSQTDLASKRNGQLWAGKYPGNGDLDLLRQYIQSFLDKNITYFINLTETAERADHYEQILHQEAEKRKQTAVHRRFPIRDYDVPPTQLLHQVLDEIDSAVADGRNVYVHCWGGIGRTGTVIGCWLVRHGLSGQEALSKIAQWRRATPNGDHPSPETVEQRNLVLNWSE